MTVMQISVSRQVPFWNEFGYDVSASSVDSIWSFRPGTNPTVAQVKGILDSACAFDEVLLQFDQIEATVAMGLPRLELNKAAIAYGSVRSHLAETRSHWEMVSDAILGSPHTELAARRTLSGGDGLPGESATETFDRLLKCYESNRGMLSALRENGTAGRLSIGKNGKHVVPHFVSPLSHLPTHKQKPREKHLANPYETQFLPLLLASQGNLKFSPGHWNSSFAEKYILAVRDEEAPPALDVSDGNQLDLPVGTDGPLLTSGQADIARIFSLQVENPH